MNRGRCSGTASTAGSLLRDCDPDHDLAPGDPDPALQIQLDLSHVNYLATAN
ncbi:hypothetical protein AFEL58S_03552 [Afipia felis]